MDIYNSNERRDTFFLVTLVIGAIVFYLPFISRQFMGDDWLWLANAKQALVDPAHFFSRAMYGYLRPLNMMFHSLMVSVFGLNAVAYGLLSVLLHSCNIVLLWFLLKKMTSNKLLIFSSLIVFGFYCLDYSAIGWISVNHDLFVTGLSLLFTILMLEFSRNPGKDRFFILFLLALAATFFKESGIITIGIYFLILVLNKKSPFSRKLIWYSSLMIIASLIYIIVYFITRTYIDKEVIIDHRIIINLWYFIVYLFFPVPERALSLIPENFIGYLRIFKIVLTFVIPLIFIYLFWRGDKLVRLFIAWLVLFLAPVSLFNLGINLLDLTSHRTISRFMYSAMPGMAVVVSVIISKLFSNKNIVSKIIIGILLIVFISGNWVITKKSSYLFFSRQNLSTGIVNSFNNIQDRLIHSDNLYIIESEKEPLPEMVRGCFHLKAITYALYNKEINVELATNDKLEFIYNQNNSIVLYYLNSGVSDKCLIPLEQDAGIYPAYYENN